MDLIMDLKYEKIDGRELNPQEAARFIESLRKSRYLELVDELPTGQLNHIVLRGTDTVVGYLGADNQVEKVNPQDKTLEYSHGFLEGVYEGCLDENQPRRT